jgi:serine/threonine protein kinase
MAGGPTARAALLAGRYEPLDLLGSGGQARVVRAFDHQHARLVVLKIRHATSARAKEAALAEARALLELGAHPSIAILRDDFFSGRQHVMVMDHVDGADLAAARPHRRSDVMRWLRDIALALDHVHRAGAVHGDVKPANIVVAASTGRAVLVDFGSAAAGRKRPLTHRYAAPEVARCGPSAAADVFALAATAFELLTGAPVEPGRSCPWPGLQRGMATDPRRRMPSAGALIAALTADLGSEGDGIVPLRPL